MWLDRLDLEVWGICPRSARAGRSPLMLVLIAP